MISLSTPVGLPRPQSKLKTTEHAAICGTLIISCNSNIGYSLTCSKIWEKGPKRQKILRIDHFSWVWSLFPVAFDPKRKRKVFGKKLWNTLSWFSSNTLWFATGLAQNPEKMDHNDQNHFHKCQQSCIPTSIIKEKKNTWARNYM